MSIKNSLLHPIISRSDKDETIEERAELVIAALAICHGYFRRSLGV